MMSKAVKQIDGGSSEIFLSLPQEILAVIFANSSVKSLLLELPLVARSFRHLCDLAWHEKFQRLSPRIQKAMNRIYPDAPPKERYLTLAAGQSHLFTVSTLGLADYHLGRAEFSKDESTRVALYGPTRTYAPNRDAIYAQALATSLPLLQAHNITGLRITDHFVSCELQVGDLMAKLPNLTWATVEIESGSQAHWTAHVEEQLVFPRLRYLRLTGRYAHWQAAIFAGSYPSLVTLDVDMVFTAPAALLPVFLDMDGGICLEAMRALMAVVRAHRTARGAPPPAMEEVAPNPNRSLDHRILPPEADGEYLLTQWEWVKEARPADLFEGFCRDPDEADEEAAGDKEDNKEDKKEDVKDGKEAAGDDGEDSDGDEDDDGKDPDEAGDDGDTGVGLGRFGGPWAGLLNSDVFFNPYAYEKDPGLEHLFAFMRPATDAAEGKHKGEEEGQEEEGSEEGQDGGRRKRARPELEGPPAQTARRYPRLSRLLLQDALHTEGLLACMMASRLASHQLVEVHLSQNTCNNKVAACWAAPLARHLEAAHQAVHPGLHTDGACGAGCPSLHRLLLAGHFCGRAQSLALDAAFARAQCDLCGWRCHEEEIHSASDRYSQATE
ncbi:hypothetical protein PAPYR_2009 [Paratrimastix pyriformis]|uniref:F-box domain-containing protein n=1 Tax=Paratrimastix pyriformis TaxID=342808 RepID=A0ABQ8UQK1_9EUKA|nr:hypothetical protein PAPYR_2009 [Paratrimastix pyriformis]